MKIRIRLTIWYFTVTLLILILFSFGIFSIMKNLIFNAIDKDLKISADIIERSYDPQFNKFMELETQSQEINPFIDFYIILYDTSSKPVYRSSIASKVQLDVPLSKQNDFTLYVLKKHIHEKIPYINPIKGGIVTFRVHSKKIYYENRFIGWLTIGITMSRIDNSIRKLQFSLFIGILCAMILIGAGGYFLTQKALKPVDNVTKKANQISHSNLDERIEITNINDELGQLSITLNNLFDRLQSSFELQQEFLSDAAHELKTPLAILRTHWENELNNEELSLKIKQQLVQDIETITRLNHLINNLLLLTQTEAVRSDLDYVPVRLDDIITEVLSDTKILSDSKSIEIQVIELPNIEILGNSVRLYQLFFNLIDNAIKYTSENGKIWISVNIRDQWAVINLRDNGVGISAEHLPYIFERFYRIHKDRARTTGGSGLGLSICKLIVQLHKGKIEVRSTINQGSTFIIKLPLFERV